MRELDFAYWLQGFVELHGQPPTPAQWEVIKEHLALVFHKVTTKSADSSSVFNPMKDTFYCGPTRLCTTEEPKICGSLLSDLKPTWPVLEASGSDIGLIVRTITC